jgi:hypothetical protein
MTIPIIAQVAVDVLSATFALAGIIHLSGSIYLRAVYRIWHYPHNFHRIVGLTQLMTALFLIVPEMRIWGIGAGGMITFVATVTLLYHRQYVWSLPAIVLLMGLIPALMAHS